jgi:sporulation protein YlmC with PRC-barrel domain
VDPVARRVTHLVVEPKHRTGLGKLVPVDLLEADAGEVRLRCTIEEFERLEAAEETHFLPGTEIFGYASGQVYALPYFSRGLASGIGGGGGMAMPIIEDKLPPGEVAVRRGEQVHATDGDIGRVQGLVVDPDDHGVTHVLLQEGHLWGRKSVAIPIGSVIAVDDGIRLAMTKQEVGDLPSVEIDPYQDPDEQKAS